MKLNQVLAIEKGEKAKANDALTKFYHECQKPALFTGLIKTYTPRDEEGEPLPPERSPVQVNAEDAFRAALTNLAALLNITAAKDWSNCEAKADVVVDGKTLLPQVPVTHLLWLEKQLTDLHTNIKTLPVLDASESWSKNQQTGLWETSPATTLRTKKVPKNHVKAEATKEHPAQVEVYTEDVVIGEFRTIKLSGAYPATRVRELLEKIDALKKAVMLARETANAIDVVKVPKVGEVLLDYIFG